MNKSLTRPTIDQAVTFLYTENLTHTARFYESILQLPLVLDQGTCRIYKISDAGFIGFCEAGAGVNRSVMNPNGVIITLVSDQVDAWAAYLTENDVILEKKPTFNSKFNIYHLFLRDPNGFLIEIQTFNDPAWPRNQSQRSGCLPQLIQSFLSR